MIPGAGEPVGPLVTSVLPVAAFPDPVPAVLRPALSGQTRFGH